MFESWRPSAVRRRAQTLARLVRTPGANPRHLSPSLVLAVFSAALFTSLAVTVISTRSVGDYLREDLRLKLPAVLRAAQTRLDLWYSQRHIDVTTFAGSAALVENADRLARGDAPDSLAAERVRSYLDAARSRYSVYSAFFLLDRSGEIVLTAGPQPLLESDLRRELAKTGLAAGAQERWLVTHRAQVFSAPVARAQGRLSLHAWVPVAAARSALDSIERGRAGAIRVVGASGETLVGETAWIGPPLRELAEGLSMASLHVEEVVAEDGRPLIIAAVPYPRFGWTLATEAYPAQVLAPGTGAVRRLLGVKLATALAFTLFAVLLSGAVLRPMLEFREAARSLAERETGSVPVPPGASGPEPEVGLLARTFQEMRELLQRYQNELRAKREEIAAANERLRAQNEKLRQANEVLERLSVTDELTGLYNQRYFREHLPREMTRATRTGEPLGLILFDVDDFKQLNDRFGHAAGDMVLRTVAQVMGAQVREMDLLARYGGEEFALLASQTPLDGASALAEKIRVAVSHTPFALGDDGPSPSVHVTISAGVAAFRGDERALFDDADRALYRAKAAGKDCVVRA
jgi:diguanylate cyclase (GGDEF)-like protein